MLCEFSRALIIRHLELSNLPSHFRILQNIVINYCKLFSIFRRNSGKNQEGLLKAFNLKRDLKPSWFAAQFHFHNNNLLISMAQE